MIVTSSIQEIKTEQVKDKKHFTQLNESVKTTLLGEIKTEVSAVQ